MGGGWCCEPWLSDCAEVFIQVDGGGKMVPPFNTCTRGSLSSIFFTLFALTEEFGFFFSSIRKRPQFFLLLESYHYVVLNTAHNVL